MAFEPFMAQRGIVATAEQEHGLAHPLCVERLEADEKMEVGDCQARHAQDQVWLQLRDHILQGDVSVGLGLLTASVDLGSCDQLRAERSVGFTSI